MRVSAKVDYAVRAGAELAAAAGAGPVKGDTIAQAQKIPLKFLENILLDLKHAGLVQSQRGAEGGYWLAEEPAGILPVGAVRAGEGPGGDLTGVRDPRGRGPDGKRAGRATRAGGVLGCPRAAARGLDRRARQ